MSRWLHAALLSSALACTGCAGTETGNPDPSAPHHDAGTDERDGAVRPRVDGGAASDASVPADAGGGQDAGARGDAGLDGGPDEDGGDIAGADAGS